MAENLEFFARLRGVPRRARRGARRAALAAARQERRRALLRHAPAAALGLGPARPPAAAAARRAASRTSTPRGRRRSRASARRAPRAAAASRSSPARSPSTCPAAPMSSSWIAEAAAVFAKDWRCELRARTPSPRSALFAVTSLVVASLALGPVGIQARGAHRLRAGADLADPALLAAAGLPRAFVARGGVAHGDRAAAGRHALGALRRQGGLHASRCSPPSKRPSRRSRPRCSRSTVARPGLLRRRRSPWGASAWRWLRRCWPRSSRRGAGRTTLFAALAFPVLVPLLALAVGAHPGRLRRAAPGRNPDSIGPV